MIPRTPILFHIEEGEDSKATPMPSSGELVGLRLIIQPSPRQQPPLAVLRRLAVRSPAASASECQGISGWRFVRLEFLKYCFCCHKQLDGNMDVFVYKGEQAFCSAQCRCEQMAKEERREIEILLRKRRDAFHSRRAASAKTRGPDRRVRVKPRHDDMHVKGYIELDLG